MVCRAIPKHILNKSLFSIYYILYILTVIFSFVYQLNGLITDFMPPLPVISDDPPLPRPPPAKTNSSLNIFSDDLSTSPLHSVSPIHSPPLPHTTTTTTTQPSKSPPATKKTVCFNSNYSYTFYLLFLIYLKIKFHF